MTNTEIDPKEYECQYVTCTDAIDIITARPVPLGGPRAMPVQRTLPHKKRTMIGPWCFIDYFGPDNVSTTGGMAVPRHPHTGLATVSLLFSGNIDHIDSTGFSNTVKPGEVNLMIAGTGVSHSEFSTSDTTILHGVQLWYALPESQRFTAPESHHFVPQPQEVNGGYVLTYLGDFAGASSPIDTRVEAMSAEVLLGPRSSLTVDVDPTNEYGVLAINDGIEVTVDHAGETIHQPVSTTELAYVSLGHERLTLTNNSEKPARAIVVGGKPFGERIVMWWNFIGRTHEEIVAFRHQYQYDIGLEPKPAESLELPIGMSFGPFPDNTPQALPAPVLPTIRLKSRGN